MCVSTGLLRSMGIILRTQKMAAGISASPFVYLLKYHPVQRSRWSLCSAVWIVSFSGSAHSLRKDMYLQCALAAVSPRHRRDEPCLMSESGTLATPAICGLERHL